MVQPILVGKSAADAPVSVSILPRMANRHGLVAGATGTGKTVTLQRLAESFSRIGVPVFLADVKGDLAGLSQAGGDSGTVAKRVQEMGLEAEEGFTYAPCPVTFWDILGEQGHPVRTTLTEMGPLMLARLMRLNEVQEGVLNIVFRLADDNGWLLWISRTCARCSHTWRTTPGRCVPTTAMSPRRASGPSSAAC